jgi:hypothetical protein
LAVVIAYAVIRGIVVALWRMAFPTKIDSWDKLWRRTNRELDLSRQTIRLMPPMVLRPTHMLNGRWTTGITGRQLAWWVVVGAAALVEREVLKWKV